MSRRSVKNIYKKLVLALLVFAILGFIFIIYRYRMNTNSSVFHFYNRYHYGDNILNLKFLYNISNVLKEKNIKIVYYYDTDYIKNKDELERYIDPSIIRLESLDKKPNTAVELWMGNPINNVSFNLYDTYYNLFYKQILEQLALENEGINTSLYQDESYLLGIYEKLDPKYKDLDILIINGEPQSAQFKYDREKMNKLCIRLAKTNKVATTTCVNDSIPCTMKDRLTMQDIGAISTHAKYIIAIHSGPIVTCFNSYTKKSVKKWFILSKDITHKEIIMTHIDSSDSLDSIQI